LKISYKYIYLIINYFKKKKKKKKKLKKKKFKDQLTHILFLSEALNIKQFRFPEWGNKMTIKRIMICPPFFLFQKEEKN